MLVGGTQLYPNDEGRGTFSRDCSDRNTCQVYVDDRPRRDQGGSQVWMVVMALLSLSLFQ